MKKLPLLLLLATLIGVLAASGRPKAPSPSQEDVSKADYIYLEAMRARSQDNDDATYELLRRAYELNPTDRSTGVELAAYMLMLSDGDSLKVAESMDMMRQYLDSAPSDYFVGVRYGLLNERMLNRDEAIRTWRSLHYQYPERTELIYKLAEVLGQGGDEDDRNEAVALYDSIEAVEGLNIPLATKKIQIYVSENDTASIIAEADRLRSSQQSNVDFMVFSGEVYAMFGRKEEALGFFDKACQLDPSSGYAYYSKAQFYNEQGDSVGYDREVFNALKQRNLEVNTKLMILRGYIRDMFQDSIQQPRIRQLFDTLIVQHPLEHDIYESYSMYLSAIRDYKGAAEQLEQTLGLDPADPEGWELLGSLYLQTEDYEKAEDAVNRSLHYYPDNPRQNVLLGALYNQKKEYDRAYAQFRKALSLAEETTPADPELMSGIYTSMGDNFSAREMKDSAFIYYGYALEMNPVNYLALNNMAYHLACEGRDLDKALSMIEKVIEAEPGNATTLDTYAWVLFKRKDYAKAREIIDKTMESATPDELSEELLEHAGDIYFMDGEPDRALDFWREALKLAPGSDILKRKVKHKTYFFK